MNKTLAKLRAIEIARKTKKEQRSGGLPSQWDGMTSDNRLLRLGHFQKTGQRAKLDFLREELRKLKSNKGGMKIVVVKR